MKLRFKRGTAEQLDQYTGQSGELAIDTTNQRVRVFDGSTQGGKEIGNLQDILTAEQILQLTSDASNLTEGQLSTQRLDIHSLFGKVRIKEHDSSEFWYTDGGSLAPAFFGSGVEEIWKFEGHSTGVFGLAVDSEGYVYSGGGLQDPTVKKIDPEGNQVWKFEGHSQAVYSLAVDSQGHDGRIEGLAVDSQGYVYSASRDGTVRKLRQFD